MSSQFSQSGFYQGSFKAYESQEIISEYFGTLYKSEGAKCTLIHVPKGLHLQSKITLEEQNSVSHVLVIVEEGAKASIEEFLGSTVTTRVIEIFVKENASLQYLSLQVADDVSIQQRSAVSENASVHYQNISLGKGMLEHAVESTLIGDHAVSTIDWMFYAKGTEKQNITADNVFLAKNGAGEITLKGAAEEKARVDCKGMIKIGLGGGGTDTYLTESVLMLDPTAKIHAVPGLEIKTNDVKASHSATVSRVTKEDLFYFGARGIEEKTARHMYIVGFLSGLLERIHDEETREKIITRLEEKYAS